MIATTSILGVPVSLLTMPKAVAEILSWIETGASRYICVRDVHGIMQAQNDPDLLKIQIEAGMVTPDGMPLVWIARRRGHAVERVSGADLVDALCHASRETGIGHYLYGGKPGVADEMATRLAAKHPGLRIVGTHCPPFRSLTTDEDGAVVADIRRSGARIVWVGISTPKQEYWMRDHTRLLPGVTLIGVGAAFDFHAGQVKRAPAWMQRAGFEWLHRLASEPRRLWRRYLVIAPHFLVKLAFARTDGRRT